jgi:hypothetical protein
LATIAPLVEGGRVRRYAGNSRAIFVDLPLADGSTTVYLAAFTNVWRFYLAAPAPPTAAEIAVSFNPSPNSTAA